MKKLFFVPLILGIVFCLAACQNIFDKSGESEIDERLAGTWESERTLDEYIYKVTLSLSTNEDEETFGTGSLTTSVSIIIDNSVNPPITKQISILDKTYNYTKWYTVDNAEFYLKDGSKELSLGGYTFDNDSSPTEITFSKGFSYKNEDVQLSLPFTKFVKK